MSRSYRKPYVTEGYGGKWRKIAKRWSNKRTRQFRDTIPDGRAYIKISLDPWLICDWKFYVDDDELKWKAKRK